MQPSEFYDKSGAYSGSAYVIDGELCVYYTGNERNGIERKTHQCLATSTDGRNWRYKKIGDFKQMRND